MATPDLSPIENWWCLLDEKVFLECCHKKEEFLVSYKQNLIIDEDYLKRLVKSMPGCLEVVIRAKGHNTK